MIIILSCQNYYDLILFIHKVNVLGTYIDYLNKLKLFLFFGINSCEFEFCDINLRSCTRGHKMCKMCIEDVIIKANENGYNFSYFINNIFIFRLTLVPCMLDSCDGNLGMSF
jgi:hypothetical protein